MTITKTLLSERLIEGYVKNPPSLQEQAFTKLAIQLCQTSELKRDIICASDALTVEMSRENDECYNTWEDLIKTQSKTVCKTISFPPSLQSELILRIRLIALELFSWNKQHQAIFHTSPYATDQFLIPSDWTIEGRLDEAKIAERLVQDERITVSRRYRLACIYSMEQYIVPLWNRATKCQQKGFRGRTNLSYNKTSDLVKLISYYLSGKLHELRSIDSDVQLRKHQLKKATEEGARTAFVRLWNTLAQDERENVIIPLARIALSRIVQSPQTIWMTKVMQNHYSRLHSRPEHYSDILYFLFSYMNLEQRVWFFNTTLHTHRRTINYFRYCSPDFDDPVFECFLQWSHRDFFIPITTRLWDCLPEDIYALQLLMLAYRYARHAEGRQEKQDFAYGVLLVELLEQTPENYKRYVFSTTIPELGITRGTKILLEMIEKQPPHEYKDEKIFQRFLRQATPEEKLSMIYYQCGDILCSHLIYKESFELIDCILSECLSEERMVRFKKRFFLSQEGNRVCFWLLKQENESSANLFINWGGLTEGETAVFKSELFYRNQSTFRVLLENLETNQLDRLLSRCLLSQAARTQYKKQLIDEIKNNIFSHFVTQSKWDELKQFLLWCCL